MKNVEKIRIIEKVTTYGSILAASKYSIMLTSRYSRRHKGVGKCGLLFLVPLSLWYEGCPISKNFKPIHLLFPNHSWNLYPYRLMCAMRCVLQVHKHAQRLRAQCAWRIHQLVLSPTGCMLCNINAFFMNIWIMFVIYTFGGYINLALPATLSACASRQD